jgi:outer membrane protein TolC
MRHSAQKQPYQQLCLLVVLMVCGFITSQAQIPIASPTPNTSPPPVVPQPTVNPMTLDEALRLADAQASLYQTALLNEKIAAEDVKQAQAAFLPKVSAPLGYIYTSPAFGLPPGAPRTPSFISADAIGEYEAFLNLSGDFDISGKLRATLAKNRALLAAAHAGTDVAKHALAQAVIEAYYGLALASADRSAAEGNLAAAQEFERITGLMLSGGEVAAVDLTRAELQTLERRNELAKAGVNEEVAASSLRVLVGYEFTRPINALDLALTLPTDTEYQQFKVDDVTRRAEFTQLDQQLRAARQEIRIARADRLPSFSYSVNGGFQTDSMKPSRLDEHSGVSAGFSFNIPIFDWGSSRSRERQARLQVQVAENERAIATRQFTQEFYAARAQVANALARIALAREGVLKAQDNLSASIARYRAGEAQIIEVTDAQTMLVTQRSALYQALFDYQIGLAKLRRASGQ